MTAFRSVIDELEDFSSPVVKGQVAAVSGLSLFVREFPAPVGAMCRVQPRCADGIEAAVVGFRADETMIALHLHMHREEKARRSHVQDEDHGVVRNRVPGRAGGAHVDS